MDLQNSRRSYITSFHKGHKTFYGTRVYGSGTILKAPDSDMRLHVPPDVEAFVYGHAHTGIQHFLPHIPEDECLVAPVAEYHCVYKNEGQDKNEDPFKIMIPHCIRNRDALSSIKVRHGDIYKNKPFHEITYRVDESYITIFTNEIQPIHLHQLRENLLWSRKGLCIRQLDKVPFSATSELSSTLLVQPAIQYQRLQEGKKPKYFHTLYTNIFTVSNECVGK